MSRSIWTKCLLSGVSIIFFLIRLVLWYILLSCVWIDISFIESPERSIQHIPISYWEMPYCLSLSMKLGFSVAMMAILDNAKESQLSTFSINKALPDFISCSIEINVLFIARYIFKVPFV